MTLPLHYREVLSSDAICLIDDEPSVLKALGRLLASEGLGAEKFTEPAHFLTYAQDHAVRLAVIDVRMPGLTGLEVQAALRALQPQANVIVMTAEDNADHRASALTGGASAFFLKPLNNDAFLAAVHAALKPPAA